MQSCEACSEAVIGDGPQPDPYVGVLVGLCTGCVGLYGWW